jgi:hypothetical protein
MCLMCEEEAKYRAWLEWQAQQARANGKAPVDTALPANPFVAEAVEEGAPQAPPKVPH